MPEDNDVKLLNQLTLCSVSFYSNELLNINLETTLRLNKIDMLRWIVVDNNIGTNQLEQPSMNPLFEVIKGETNSFTGKVKGSYHHAQALKYSPEIRFYSVFIAD